MTEQSSPAFKQALAEYQRIASLYGEDSEQAMNQFIKLLHLAPQHYQDMAWDMAKEMGLIPRPSGYSDDGQPLYDVSSIAKHFGVDESEIISSLDELDPTHAHRYTGNINRIQ